VFVENNIVFVENIINIYFIYCLDVQQM